MLNEPKLNPNDSLGVLLRSAYSKMNPPPALESAVISGIPYAPRANTALHVRRFAKAIASYAICVILLIGGVYFASELMGETGPFATSPSEVSTAVSDPDLTTDADITTDSKKTTTNPKTKEPLYNGVPDVTYHPDIPSVNYPATPTAPFPTVKDPTPQSPTPDIPRPNSPNPWPSNNPWYYP